jgi:hypothetical protein
VTLNKSNEGQPSKDLVDSDISRVLPQNGKRFMDSITQTTNPHICDSQIQMDVGILGGQFGCLFKEIDRGRILLLPQVEPPQCLVCARRLRVQGRSLSQMDFSLIETTAFHLDLAENEMWKHHSRIQVHRFSSSLSGTLEILRLHQGPCKFSICPGVAWFLPYHLFASLDLLLNCIPFLL